MQGILHFLTCNLPTFHILLSSSFLSADFAFAPAFTSTFSVVVSSVVISSLSGSDVAVVSDDEVRELDSICLFSPDH